ncbi:WecB/TagA/CpsF family glycosyltransferase [Actinoplanes sp. NPDC024001]|uniref:WecB/TagA/CpsF family glycosyltransferase n=1 Tax=Actinoplanes sp. NPDC024001 TaxID=3154598 RepID=UPI003411B0F0
MTIEAFDRVHLDGTGIDRITEDEVVAVVRDALAAGRGGRIITPNVDILRRASADPEVRRHLDDADLIVADGMPLVWASRLNGAPLPERVAGSSLIWSLSAGLGRDGRSIYIAGGAPAPQPTPGAVGAEPAPESTSAPHPAPSGAAAAKAGSGAALGGAVAAKAGKKAAPGGAVVASVDGEASLQCASGGALAAKAGSKAAPGGAVVAKVGGGAALQSASGVAVVAKVGGGGRQPEFGGAVAVKSAPGGAAASCSPSGPARSS